MELLKVEKGARCETETTRSCLKGREETEMTRRRKKGSCEEPEMTKRCEKQE